MSKLDSVFLFVLIIFTIMLPMGTWALNPIWILLFARVSDIAFTNVHFTSVASISVVCFYLIVRDRSASWVPIVFAGAGLHEWMVYVWNFILNGWGILNFWKDALWLAGFIIVGVWFANKEQRIMLGVLASYLFVIMGVYVGGFHNSELEIGIYTQQAIADNFIEVFGWVTVPLAFVFIRPIRNLGGEVKVT